MSDPIPSELVEREQPDVRRFTGQFMVFKIKSGRHLSKRVAGMKMPWFRHPTLEAAEAEAARLTEKFPASTFLIMQEVSRVKTLEAGHE